MRMDLFYQGQMLFRLQCDDNRTNYRMMYKKFGESEWEPLSWQPMMDIAEHLPENMEVAG